MLKEVVAAPDYIVTTFRWLGNIRQVPAVVHAADMMS